MAIELGDGKMKSHRYVLYYSSTPVVAFQFPRVKISTRGPRVTLGPRIAQLCRPEATLSSWDGTDFSIHRRDVEFYQIFGTFEKLVWFGFFV